jgi:two-component system OmpR family sensor kinase
MLVLAKLDEERPLQLRRVDVAALARDAVADARATAPHRQIALDAGEGDATVEGDEDRLRQVIANVVGNALVHTEPDVPIAVRWRVADGRVTLDVIDRGHGMPPDVLERATERFYRADPARARHRGGSGLGLSIVDAAVAAHGGTFTIESEPGAGTTVSLVLPATSATPH